MDSIIYPGADKLWPTRVGDPPRSSAFVDLTSQNELYQRNQGTCGYGECIEGSCRLFIRSYNTSYSASTDDKNIHNLTTCITVMY